MTSWKALAAKTAMAAALAATALAFAGTAQAADPAACKAVRFGDVGWTDIAATTALASVTLEGLGYTPTTTMTSVPLVYTGLKTRSLDVFLGNWMPTMETFLKPAVEEGSVEVTRVNLEGAKYTLAVPKYAADAGLTSFADLAKFKDKLDGKIYGIEAGNDGNLIIDKMLKAEAFGLKGFKLVESSEAGMLAEVKRAVRAKKFIAFLGWTPHPMNKSFELTYLAGGDEWFGPDFGGATVSTNTRKGYAADCPNVGRLLANLSFTLDMENAVMDDIMNASKKPDAAAKAWLKKNPDVLKAWLSGVTTLDGKDGLAAVQAKLGIAAKS
ncbi:choline ABC transporter substrate-binding protein [Azospirillum agricola]|uniref:choline ABC transporter substrate-binding protein n=1 Tax=Azospirillum agricola TaxID=1720247 RepID=UPI000A0EFFEA|nr:choline ABC transporter substrate-binding protein [Azospirillum agricola]SMH29306.1 glycine betaine/proline transport system substrate-binding protein [Azospirillum lipoferum]